MSFSVLHDEWLIVSKQLLLPLFPSSSLSTTQTILLSPSYNRSLSDPNTLIFSPYIYNFVTNYPPQNLDLSPLTPVPSTPGTVQLLRDEFICTVCDNKDRNGTNCLPNEYLDPKIIDIKTLYRKCMLVHIFVCVVLLWSYCECLKHFWL